MTRLGGPRPFPPTVWRAWCHHPCRRALCVWEHCLHPLEGRAEERRPPLLKSMPDRLLPRLCYPVSLVSPFSCRNKNQPTHPETGLCCLASCAKPWAPPYFFFFFWKCSNLQEHYKNSTMSTITQILLLALDTLSPLFECICFVKPLLWC